MAEVAVTNEEFLMDAAKLRTGKELHINVNRELSRKEEAIGIDIGRGCPDAHDG